jgi:predicted ATPase/DNA-binding winged helix-turn-helix (wHTH) protein
MDFPSPIKPDSGTRVGSRDDEEVAFGNYRIFPELKLLLKNGNKVDLTARAFDVLWVLVKARGEVVTKDQLIEQVWAGFIVEENNLQTHISAIRRALKQDRNLISTDFGRGYRLTLPASAKTNLLVLPPAKKVESPNLPSPLTTLLGRDNELRALQQLITANRLTTITGPGGIGKTRLAVEVGRRLLASFSERVQLVEMGMIGERDNIWPAIARALGVEATDVGLTAESCAALQSQRLLLIVDNCEHLTEAIAGAVETLLRIGDGIHICVTSQEPFGTQGEQIYRIRPLPVPPEDASTMEVVLTHAAAQLFVERSLSYTHDSPFDDATACEIAAICRQLDGVPLALELAAARVPTLGVRGVLDGLSDRFRLLTAGQRGALPRQRTLKATVDWSHQLLGETERTLFRRLAVFPAGFTVEAAHSVSGPDIEDQWQIIDLLGNLVGKSLLHLDVSGATPRYRFLETIRLYALDELANRGETDLTARRHAAYFQRIGEQAVADWKRQSTGEWRRVHRGYVEDMRAALKWAFSENGDTELGVRMIQNAIPFWVEFSLLDECRRWVSLALDQPGVTETSGTYDEMVLRAALGRSLSWARGPVAETKAAWSRALELARELGDTQIQLQCQYGLWLFSLRTGHYSEAMCFATEMMTLATEAKDDEAFATAQRLAGVSRHSLGDHADGRALIERSLLWFEQHRPQSSFRFGLDQHAAGLGFLARILWVQGYTNDAVKTANVAVERALALDHASTLCLVLAEGLCMVSALNQDLDALETAVQTLTCTASHHGLHFWKAYGDLYELWAMHRREKLTAGRITSVIRRLDDMQFNLCYTPFVADVLLSSASSVGSMWTSFRPSVDGEDSYWAMPEFLRIEAEFDLERNAGRFDSTVEHRLERALALAHECGAHSWELKVAATFARLLIGDNRRDQAQILLRSTISSFPSGNESNGLRTANALLNELQHSPSPETSV